jgi:hypothetical protein
MMLLIFFCFYIYFPFACKRAPTGDYGIDRGKGEEKCEVNGPVVFLVSVFDPEDVD